MEIETRSGLRFRARTDGDPSGRPILLLHGFPQTSHCFTQQLPPLAAAGCFAVAFDQRGYSPNARPDDVAAYKPALLVSDVLDVADALELERFDLVGHDFGGMVAWMVAGHHPDRVRTLTVASTPHPAAFRSSYKADGEQNEKSSYMRAFREGERGAIEASLLADDGAALRLAFHGLPDVAADAYIAALSEPGALVAAIDWYRSMSAKASAATPPSTVPTLYAWGDQDPALGRTAAEATASQVTGPYRFEVLEGTGHWIPELAADRFNALLLDHLARHAD